MARNLGGKGPMPSRVRVVLVEAEGDIGAVMQTIQNAFRPAHIPQPKRIGSSKAAGNGAAEEAQPEFDFEAEAEAEEIEDSDASESAAARPRGARKLPPTPNIVTMDMHGGVSLSSFAAGKDSKSQNKKYLIAAAWLKEHRGIDAITADHIYTCFRSLEWSTNIPDFWQPLRNLKAKRYFTTNDKNEYVINHLGLDYVKKLGGANGAG